MRGGYAPRYTLEEASKELDKERAEVKAKQQRGLTRPSSNEAWRQRDLAKQQRDLAALQAQCSICALRVDRANGKLACRCDHFPLAMPSGLALGDVVTCTSLTGDIEAIALYFVHEGATKVHNVSTHRHLLCEGKACPYDGVIVTRGVIGDVLDWLLYPVENVELKTIIDLTGRRVRAPSWYMSERVAASRIITRDRRLECFNKTLGGKHRCFSCFALLIFTMDEEFTINTDVDTLDADKVRCHEAGHIFAHSLGKPIIGDDIDGSWNLMPLCHNCNCRMGRQLAWTFIAASHATHLHMQEFVDAKAHYEQSLPEELK